MAFDLAFRIWSATWISLAAGFILFAMFSIPEGIGIALIASVVALFGSIPALFIMGIAFLVIDRFLLTSAKKIVSILFVNFFICLAYGLIAGDQDHTNNAKDNYSTALVCTSILFTCSAIAFLFHYKFLKAELLKCNENVDLNDQAEIETKEEREIKELSDDTLINYRGSIE